MSYFIRKIIFLYNTTLRHKTWARGVFFLGGVHGTRITLDHCTFVKEDIVVGNGLQHVPILYKLILKCCDLSVIRVRWPTLEVELPLKELCRRDSFPPITTQEIVFQICEQRKPTVHLFLQSRRAEMLFNRR